MFELLFNEPLASWTDARLVLDGPWGFAGLGAAVVLAFLAVAFGLARRSQVGLAASRRTLLGVLQGAALAALLAMLWRPSLELETVGPGENRVAWLVDTSASMATADVEDRSRLVAAVDALRSGAVLDDEGFEHSTFALGPTLEPVASLDALDAGAGPGERAGQGTQAGTGDAGLAGTSTDIGDAVRGLLDAVDERALAAVVLVSDGAENAGSVDADWWRRVAAAGVPVHTVGVGATERAADVELVDVSLPERVAAGSTVTARLRIGHAPGAPDVRLRVSAGDSLLAAEDVRLSADADETVHTVRLDAGEARLAELRFALDTGPADPEPANDVQVRVLDVADAPRRVLYLEGEPRWEFKFIRRALEDEPGVEIVSLLRTSPNKFYRQGVRDADELADGFPATAEALYAYDAVIVGSVEASLLDPVQQAALRDFVAVRGGGLLMLGGRAGLADGGWARSAVASALPVVLASGAGPATFERTRTRVLPTRHGARTDWLRLDPDPAASLAAWGDMPELADRQDVGRVKPGAAVLLASPDGSPVLVRQRYGRGASYVLATSGTWRWQMSLPSKDLRHEDFWRGLVGTLAGSSAPRLAVRAERPVVRGVDGAGFTVEARDADWAPLASEALQATLLRPDGARVPANLVADPAVPGRYLASADFDADGPWGLEVQAVASGESPPAGPVSATGWTVHEGGTAEAFGALQQRAFLERLARATGGEYLDLDEVGRLPALLASSGAALTRSVRLPLWNMPAFFLLILGAKAFEWLLRLRWRRL